jgi:protocatechuate 3,4-dioxygenase beta subunit
MRATAIVGRLRTAPIVAALCLVLAGAPDAKAQRVPTTQTSIGIFYQPGAPETGELWRDGDSGKPMVLLGTVLDRDGTPVADALVELWHADTNGSVDESRFRATRRTGADGRFGIKTVLPGHIEMARHNSVFAPRHVHIVVSHPEHPRLVSLIFFRGDERLSGTPYPELAIPLEKSRAPAGEVLVGGVEIVLGATPLPAEDWQGAD